MEGHSLSRRLPLFRDVECIKSEKVALKLVLRGGPEFLPLYVTTSRQHGTHAA